MDDNEAKINSTFAANCPGCGGTLVFDPVTLKLKCDFCSSEFDPNMLEEDWRQKEINTLKRSEKSSQALLTVEDNMKNEGKKA